MAVRAVVPGRTKTYVFSGDVPTPRPSDQSEEDYQTEVLDKFEPTKWPLKALDSRILGLLKDKNAKVTLDASRPNDEIGTVFNQNDYAFQIVQLGLSKPENFTDENGREIKFKTEFRNIGGKRYEIAADDFVAQIPSPVIAELAEQIETLNTVTSAEGNG